MKLTETRVSGAPALVEDIAVTGPPVPGPEHPQPQRPQITGGTQGLSSAPLPHGPEPAGGLLLPASSRGRGRRRDVPLLTDDPSGPAQDARDPPHTLLHLEVLEGIEFAGLSEVPSIGVPLHPFAGLVLLHVFHEKDIPLPCHRQSDIPKIDKQPRSDE